MTDLVSCLIIEKDTNEDIIWAAIYPSASKNEKHILSRKFVSSLAFNTSFLFGRLLSNWFYMSTASDHSGCSYGIILVSNEFSPEKFSKMSLLLSKSYSCNGSSANVITLYLKILTTGSVSGKENGTAIIDFNSSFTPLTLIKDVIKLFGVEIIVLYSALLLKRRVLVYHHDLNILLQLIPTFLHFVPHRRDTSNVFPWIEASQDDLTIIKEHNTYIAGCISHLGDKESLYDVYINIPAREIIVSAHATDGLAMTKIHKDIAMYINDVGESECSEQEALSSIASKTEELLLKIRSFAKDSNRLTIEDIKEKKFSANAEKFLIEVARIENLLAD